MKLFCSHGNEHCTYLYQRFHFSNRDVDFRVVAAYHDALQSYVAQLFVVRPELPLYCDCDRECKEVLVQSGDYRFEHGLIMVKDEILMEMRL